MNNSLKLFLNNKKVSMTIFVVGIIGILLIFISDTFAKNDKNESAIITENDLSESEYCSLIESRIAEIIKSLTGNDNTNVIVTLDSTYEYVYLNEKDISNDYTNENNAETKKKDNSSEKYIIVEDSSGNERPLIVTTLSPKIRGVVIIYDYNGVQIDDEIKSAVMAALDISSSKIFVSKKLN